MEELENKEKTERTEKTEKPERPERIERREEIFSQTVRAGKRTYFFDVKETRAEELYLTITESKRRFNNEQGKFFYEKHKIFLYSEDFRKFLDGLNAAIGFIETGKAPEAEQDTQTKDKETSIGTDLAFEDLGPVDET